MQTALGIDIIPIKCRTYLENMNTDNNIEKPIMAWAHGFWTAANVLMIQRIGHGFFRDTGNVLQNSLIAENETKNLFTHICKENPNMLVVSATSETLVSLMSRLTK